jgi:hypothetical protein
MTDYLYRRPRWFHEPRDAAKAGLKVRIVGMLHRKTDEGGSRRQRNVDDKRDEGDRSYEDHVLHMIVLRQCEISMTMTWRTYTDRSSSFQRGQSALKVNEPAWK